MQRRHRLNRFRNYSVHPLWFAKYFLNPFFSKWRKNKILFSEEKIYSKKKKKFTWNNSVPLENESTGSISFQLAEKRNCDVIFENLKKI